MIHLSWADNLYNLRFALSDRKPITLANGMRTVDYQVWRVAFSSGGQDLGATGVPQGDRSQEYLVTTPPITFRELQEDRSGVVLYKKFQETCPERLFGAAYYFLEYRLPGAPFTVRVRLDDPDEIKRAYHELGNLTHKKRMHMGKAGHMRVVPREEGKPCFDFEPEPLVKVAGGTLKGQASLTNFLADLYIAGRISASDFDHVMHQSSTDMRQETFNLIPAREQINHEYLLKPAKPKKESPPEDKYHLGLITLEEYADLKRPDHAADRERLKVSWPLPERTFVCVVCGVDRATIKCMECDNRCCQDCVRREFTQHLNPSSGDDLSDNKSSGASGGQGKEEIGVKGGGGGGSGGGGGVSRRRSSLLSPISSSKSEKDNSGESKGGAAVAVKKRWGSSRSRSALVVVAPEEKEEGGGGGGGSGSVPIPGESFLLIHHIYCLRNGRPTRAYMEALPATMYRRKRPQQSKKKKKK